MVYRTVPDQEPVVLLLAQIDTEWLEYRRHFIAIVRIKDNKMRWWAYPNARGWCTRRVGGHWWAGGIIVSMG